MLVGLSAGVRLARFMKTGFGQRLVVLVAIRPHEQRRGDKMRPSTHITNEGRLMKKLAVHTLVLAGVLLSTAGAQANQNYGISVEGTLRAAAISCGGDRLLKRVLEASAKHNSLLVGVTLEQAKPNILQAQREILSGIQGANKSPVCPKITADLNTIISARERLPQLRAKLEASKDGNIEQMRRQILGELIRENGALTSIQGALLALMKEKEQKEAACKPRVVRCDITRPDGSSDWEYPRANGTCQPDHRGGNVTPVLGVPGDLAAASQSCR